MTQLGYTANYDEPEQSFEVVPAGEYVVIISESDYVPNKKNTGMILKLTYDILDGPFKGQKIFENLNLQHENAQASVIAQKALNSICMAVGIQHVADTSQLHGIPLVLDISVRDSDQYRKQNNIKKHLPYSHGKQAPSQGQTAPPAQGGFQKPPAAPVAPGGKKPQPWEI